MKIAINILKGIAVTTLALAATSCLEETFPTNEVTADQLGSDIPGLANGITAYMTSYTSISNNGTYADIGMAQNLIWHNTMTGDIPPTDVGYDYFSWYAEQNYLGDWTQQTVFWRRNYYLIQKTNAVLGSANLAYDSEDARYVGNALCYRAMTYIEQAAQYEYFRTGTDLDAKADELGIWGITVPIVTEKTTEDEARNNPRAPFYEMYRFINNDLLEAEKYLARITSTASIDNSTLGTAYGLHARLWLTMATRFRLAPDDFTLQMNYEREESDYAPLGVSTVKECYQKAQEYARKAQSMSYQPLTMAQWFDPKTGFNSPNQSWMLAIVITTDNGLADRDWQSFVSYTCPEATWGVANMSGDYKAARMIDARLWETIKAGDWRRYTWVDPADVASREAYNTKYADKTNLTFADWSNWTALVGCKFHPAGGDINTSKNGNAISIPLMRVEEMAFIEMEATLFADGFGAGKQVLETWMTNYRMEPGTTYRSQMTDEDELLDEIIDMKRVELWLEGTSYFDFRRLRKAVIKAYPGTNHPKVYQYNSLPNAVAPWSTYFIPVSECNLNTACKRNPDPSGVIPQGQTY
ncbi:MAG: RagB/SusD family nutrient uptake outer membrane protein [Muribaculaceae bacterium]|nr:RagB/SusD family nutrient uptake outer membrane protein [Muribaculaceae bacterium]